MCCFKSFNSEKKESKKQKEVQDIYACFGWEDVNKIHCGVYWQGVARCALVKLNKDQLEVS